LLSLPADVVEELSALYSGSINYTKRIVTADHHRSPSLKKSHSHQMLNLTLATLALHSLRDPQLLPCPHLPRSITTDHLFLSRSVLLSSVDRFVNETYERIRLPLTLNRTEVISCTFINVKGPDHNGGAILTFNALSIINSRFDDCEGHDGGAVCSQGPLSLHFVTFFRCTARNSGAVDLRCSENATSSMNLTLFQHCRSSYCAAFYRLSDGAFVIESLNLSSLSVDQCVGSFEAKSGSLEMSFVAISNSRATRHNGGTCFREFHRLSIDCCAFVRCQHTSWESDTGAALLIYENPEGAEMRRCAFVANQAAQSCTVSVCSGHSLRVLQCCFSGSRAREVREVNVNIEDCQFETNQCDAKMPWESGDYRPGQTDTVFAIPKTEAAEPTAEIRIDNQTAVVALSAALSLGSATILTTIHIWILQWRKTRKIPRAFQ
jgi:hypothetical protein